MMSNEYMDRLDPGVDLFVLLRGIIKSARRLLLPGILLVSLLAGLMCFRTWTSFTAQYRAEASFTVQMKNPFYATQQYYNNAVAEQMAKTFPHVLTSGVLGEQVKEELGISVMPRIEAEAIGNTNIFTMKVTAADPQVAYDVLKCVMEVYPSIAEFVVGSTELSLLSESGVPTAPVSTPNYIQSAFIGGVVGAALWAGLAVLYWFTHRTVSDEEELGKVVNLTCLGRLPRVRGVVKGKSLIFNDGNDKFGFNESVRLLRIRVEKALVKENAKVLLVTSTIPNEGKTTVSVNLAMAMARKGRKVLLLDCDLRNPSIGAALGMESQNGLAEYLKGKCTLKEVFHEMETENLYAVFGGEAVNNPERLLTHKNARRFLEAARQSFDYIILDTPPCAMMADASEIGTMVDCTLLTVRQNYAVRSQIQDAVQTLGDNDKPIIGTVLNMTTPQMGKNSYYSHYGSYGYYGSDSKDEEDAE